MLDAYTIVHSCEYDAGWSNQVEAAQTMIDLLFTEAPTNFQEWAERQQELDELIEQSDAGDDRLQAIFELQDDLVDSINDYVAMPAFCYLSIDNGLFHVTPCLEQMEFDDTPRVDFVPDEFIDIYILVINDHGNVTCMQWNNTQEKYLAIWDMV